MIHVVTGDLFQSSADAIVVPVNCVGTMGAGLARQVKNQYPLVNQAYLKLHREGKINIGEIHAVKPDENAPWFILFPTKYHWRHASEIEYIEKGLIALRRGLLVRNTTIDSVNIPPLGCGLGGLDFNVVKPLIEEYLADVPQAVYLYTPHQ